MLNHSESNPKVELDAALYPNSFFGVANETFVDSDEALLSLVDGGENGENIPFQPLLVKARGLDVIFAIDSVRWRLLGFSSPETSINVVIRADRG